MKLSHRDFRPRILLACLAVIVLIAAGTAVLRAIEKEYRRNIADHLISNLESMARGIALMQQDSVARARKIARACNQHTGRRLVTPHLGPRGRDPLVRE